MSRTLRARFLQDILPEGRDRYLNLYSIAAGVSILALAQPAEASVVVTNTNIAINPGNSVTVDLNNDGAKDFAFAVAVGGYDHSFYATLAITPLTGGKVVGGARGALGPYVSALASGASIGGAAHFSSSAVRGQVTVEHSNGGESGPTSTYKAYGKWTPGTSSYIGVRFLINGTIHYGWIRLTVSRTIVFSGALRVSGTITEYAYETVANKKIGAGATTDVASRSSAHGNQSKALASLGPSLGMLAIGSEGLPLWRREEESSLSGQV
jgi:hypothetical protein